MHISKAFTQQDQKGRNQTTLTITVDYDPDNRNWDTLVSVRVYNHQLYTETDITHIMFEAFHETLSEKIDSINWHEVYAETHIPELETV